MLRSSFEIPPNAKTGILASLDNNLKSVQPSDRLLCLDERTGDNSMKSKFNWLAI